VLDVKGAGLRLSELNSLKSAALGLSLFLPYTSRAKN
jgi:hypothetical protein